MSVLLSNLEILDGVYITQHLVNHFLMNFPRHVFADFFWFVTAAIVICGGAAVMFLGFFASLFVVFLCVIALICVLLFKLFWPLLLLAIILWLFLKK